MLINSGPAVGFGRMRHNWPVALGGCLVDAVAEAFHEAAGPGQLGFVLMTLVSSTGAFYPSRRLSLSIEAA